MIHALIVYVDAYPFEYNGRMGCKSLEAPYLNKMTIGIRELERMAELNIVVWLKYYGIKNENGDLMDFHSHRYLYKFLEDDSQTICVMKAAQIGMSTAAILKSLWTVKNKGRNAIYTLPTADDRNQFVGDKVNRIIAQNPILQKYTEDKDSVEQKRVGNYTIHYRGTFTQKAAMMVSSDLNAIDEVDASNQKVVEQYSTRLQHSKYKNEWYFSHPSAPKTGVDKWWEISDQKHWMIDCECGKKQYLSWPDSFDIKNRAYICKGCKGHITDEQRRKGEWVAKYPSRAISGYWMPLFMCPWVSADEIIKYHETKSEEYFANKVEGRPYTGGGNKLTEDQIFKNLTKEILQPAYNERIVIGMDTGKYLHYICGTQKGAFLYGTAYPNEENKHDPYKEIYKLMERWPKAIIVVDQGGDLIGSRKLREKYRGRVFLCSYGEDRKTNELVRWGSKGEHGNVIVDRNRMLQLVVDEIVDGRYKFQGTEDDWYDYANHWANITRIKEENDRGMVRKIWVRNGDDHWCHAHAYMRAGLSKFGGEKAEIIGPAKDIHIPTGHQVHNESVSFNPRTFK